MNLSIIIPVYFNEEDLYNLYTRTKDVILHINKIEQFEIIFIDDGSRDKSFDELLKIKNGYPRDDIKIIKFTRNFGQIAAIYAGYRMARFEAILTMSADLQDPPDLIEKMIEEFYLGFKIVAGMRQNREDGFYRKWTSSIFYNLMRKLSFPNMPKGGFDFVLISREVKETLLKSYEANPFWQGQLLWTGYSVKFIPYRRLKREVGKSRWTFSKKIKYLLDGVLSYSYIPIRLMSVMGLITAFAGFIYALFIIIMRIFGNVPFKGWAPIMVLILVLSGFQMSMLGIIGEYLWRTLDQVRKRPLYIIEKIYE